MKKILKALELLFNMNHRSYLFVNNRGPNMYPKSVPDLFSEKYRYDDIKNVWPALASGKKFGVKPGSNIRADKTHEDWYLVCEAYQKLASQDIKREINSLPNYSHFAACFTGTKSEEHYFGRFLV